MRSHFLNRHFAIGSLIVLISSSAYSTDCGMGGSPAHDSEQHKYSLTVKSTSGDRVRIKGSIAVAHPDQFISIDAETPYELTVVGAHYLLIVGSAEASDSIDFSLSIDGQEATSGSDNPLYSVGDGIPRPGGMFSANYRAGQDTD